MDTVMIESSLIRLLHLVSPSLPTGAFSYSQGLEWAVEEGWVGNYSSLKQWLIDSLHQSLARLDIPMLRAMYQACSLENIKELEKLCNTLLAFRETQEFVLEEKNRGRAMASLLESLNLLPALHWKPVVSTSQLAGYSLAASSWRIPVRQAASGYIWSWLENQTLTGIKIIPLGQTEGQQMLAELTDKISPSIDRGFSLSFDEIGASTPALAIASSLHETQYTRIYRS